MDLALNVLCALCTICNGNGPTEASRTLGVLGLPNDTTMETREFGATEDGTAPVIPSIHEDAMCENLHQEARLSVYVNKFVLWEQSQQEESNFKLQDKDCPEMDVSFDTGWNQRGQMRDSPSSHSFGCGKHMQLPVEGEALSGISSVCTAWTKQKEQKKAPLDSPTPDHHCVKNCKGSPGARMETKAVVTIVSKLFQKHQVKVQVICVDDDASTQSAPRWSNADCLKNHNTTALPQVKTATGNKKNSHSSCICSPCKRKGHATLKGKKHICNLNHTHCDPNRPLLAMAEVTSAATAAAMPQAGSDNDTEAEDMDAVDSVPFTDDLPNFEFKTDEFHDLGASDQDDNESEMPTGIL